MLKRLSTLLTKGGVSQETVRLEMFLQSNKEAQERLLQFNKEAEERNMCQMEKIEKENIELVCQLQRESYTLLQAQNKINIRGALELAADRLKISGNIKVSGTTNILASLVGDQKWQLLAEGFARDTARMEDVRRCQSNLYHSFSKSLHGTSTDKIDLSEVASEPEKVAIKATLKLANVFYSG